MAEKLSTIRRCKIIRSVRRKVGRRVHAEKRLKERFGLEYIKIRNVIDNGGAKLMLTCRNGTQVYKLVYMEKEIYFTTFHEQIKTFLTKEMVESSYPEIFEPEKKKIKKKKRKKKKRKQPELIPASKLFGEE